jgi:hypothetical protein
MKMQNMIHQIIFKTIVGSQAYGTATASSDIDYKGVYVQHPKEILAFRYAEQLEVNKDEFYYEVRRFLELLQVANPTVLELLYMPKDCVQYEHKLFGLVTAHRDKFLTTRCLQSFGGYAIAQIKKAKGLDKKMNWERDRVVRKRPLDFCYVYENGKTIALQTFLTREGLLQEYCGLTKLDHFKDCYALYYDDYVKEHRQPFGFKGIVLENSNEIRLSPIPKGIAPKTIMYYNKDGYSMHCKDYKEYQIWLETRNTQRYVDIKGHQQQIDGKNLLHCRRLLDMAKEIAVEGRIAVRRKNAAELLKIRRGEFDLQTIIAEAEQDILELETLYAQSNLPEMVDEQFVNNLLVEIREAAEDLF